MVALPLIAALISATFAGVIARDAYRRPRPDKISWVIAFSIFTIGAGAEVVGDLYEWTPLVARVFYLTGAVLVTLFLGVGELYLLFGERIKRFAPGLTLAVVALGISLVWSAPIDEARLATDKWEAMERSGTLIALVAISNAFGVVVLGGGALYSAWRFWRSGTNRHRMIGCVLIAIGTFVIASKGYAERLGISISDEVFYAFLTVGAAIIFIGYLETRRPDKPRVTAPSVAASAPVPTTETALVATEPASESVTPEPELATVAAEPTINGHVSNGAPIRNGTRTTAERTLADEGIAFIESRFLVLDDAELDALATAWSAPRHAESVLTREQARTVWAFRRRLTPAGQDAYDRLSAPALLQLADLYFGVLAPEVADSAARPSGSGEPGSPWELTTVVQ